MSTQKQTQHYSFSGLSAGSSRRRRVMMNSLVAERLDIEIADVPFKEATTDPSQQQPARKQVDVITNHSEFDDWISTIKSEPVHSDLDSLPTKQHQSNSQQSVLTSETDNINDLFDKLESLTEVATEQPLATDIEDQNSNITHDQQFETILTEMPRIAEVVKSFDSPQVQRDVFHALVNAVKQEELLKTVQNNTKANSPID